MHVSSLDPVEFLLFAVTWPRGTTSAGEQKMYDHDATENIRGWEAGRSLLYSVVAIEGGG
jgi:hypothetical protein